MGEGAVAGAVSPECSAAGKGVQKTFPKYFNDYKSEFDKICYNSLSQQTFSYEWPILTGQVPSSVCRSLYLLVTTVFLEKRLSGST